MEAIDLSRVPVRRLSGGMTMPGIGMGTFGNDRYSGSQVAAAVREALRMGYRYLDCAAAYANEADIGAEIHSALRAGLARDELFVLSKLWNDKHRRDKLIAACKQTLCDLRLDYLDCYLMHWPFPNYHAPGAGPNDRHPDSRPFSKDEFLETWHAMEDLVDMGLTRAIGTSNATIAKLECVLPEMRIRPVVNEMEMHPCFQQGEFFQYLLDRGIQPIAYSPIGSPERPARDTAPDDVSVLEQPLMREIAAAHGVHPAVICVKWAAQRGQIPIPFAAEPDYLLANLRSVTQDPLTREEMHALRSLDRDNRLIKGVVFLWEGSKSWLDLWDVDGVIAL